MARKRASMREGPLAELFRATEAAQRQQEAGGQPPEAPAASGRGAAGADGRARPDFAQAAPTRGRRLRPSAAEPRPRP